MQKLVTLSKTIVKEFRDYEYTYSSTNRATFTGLEKLEKYVDELGEDDEIFVRSCQKFWDANKEYFAPSTRLTWYKNDVRLNLYSVQGKIVKGPMLNLSDVYQMAMFVDNKKPKSSLETKEDSLVNKLQREIFKVLSLHVEEFKKSVVAVNKGPAVPFDLSKVGDLIGKIVESGIIPGSETADKTELMNVVNGFISNPKIGEIFSSVTQMVGSESGINADTLKDVLSGVTKN
ncbi:Hypothetical protein BQ3484_567 [Cedratvirus A11]|uniref:Uncharacterized protein n=1 Tax=Cedratvirus A11 TaxID=1903266 RepID=A0A1M7XVB3_9VIRU|nr:Hypothetical protein BQ3484_567 [Cedratvirus A11]SHO33635.1 Hypothetical protein BQ3484_567 [Cedratvirus A11]